MSKNTSQLILFLLLADFMISYAQPLTINVTDSIAVCKGNTVLLGKYVVIEGGELPYMYSWSPVGFLNAANISNPESSVLINATTFYLTVTDNQGNMVTDSIVVSIDSLSLYEKCNNLIFYNTFTPNGDDINDTWVILNIDKYPDNKLEIYNRYGKLVYKAEGYTNSWSGKGLSDDLPAATYYYVFDPGSGLKIKRGSVTIIR